MGRASISIAITSNFNSRGIDAAIRKAEQLAVSAVHYQGQFGKAAVDMGASMGQAAARIAAMGKSVADLGDRLTVGLTVPMGLAATAAVVNAAKIDTAWYNVRKTVDMTEEGYEQLKRSAMELSETQPVSAETILNIEALGGQLGITNDYLEDFAKVVSGLDIATNIDADTAATELAQFRNIVQMSEEDLDNWASTVVDLGNHTATTEADMVNLAMRFASAGHIAGMSNADILGLSAALSGLGMRAEAGGSAISRTINDINNAVAVGGDDLAMWADLVGKAPQEFADAWRAAPMDEFIDVLTHLNEAGSDMGAVLEDLGITQIRQSDAMRRLASSGEYVSEVVERANRAWEQNSALTQEVERRNESLQARWDTLVNHFTNDLARIGQPLAEIGLDVAEGFEPALQGIGDLTQAFADADPMVQRFAFNLAAVAMAAGPVLSVSGRIMQAVGNMGQRVGRVTQQWGVYQEALKTTDINLLNTLANNRSAAASFGASRNAIVKAAGGLDRYNLAYKRTTDAIRANIEQQVRRTVYEEAYQEALEKGNKTEEQCAIIAEKAARSRETTAVVTGRQKEAIKELHDTLTEENVAMELHTDAISDADVAAEKASRTFGKFGTALKGALIGFGASAAIGLAIAGITWLISSMQEAAEEADTFDRATNGLRDSLVATGDAAEEAGDSHRDLMGSIAETREHVRQAIEDQAELADKFLEADKQAAAQMGTIDKAADIVERYANKGSIGTAQLSLLKDAIDDVNQACGTQYEVLEDGTVVIEDETGAIKVNTDEILKNIDARKRQIQFEATESKYQSAYENLIDQTYARAEAVDRLTKARERLAELEEKGLSNLNNSEMDEYVQLTDNLANGFHGLVSQLEDDVDNMNETWGEAFNAKEYWEDFLESLGGKVEDLSQDMQRIIEPTSMFAAAFTAAKKDVVAFAAACEEAGINWQFLNSLTETEIQELADNFDGSTASIVESLERLGKTEALDSLASNWRRNVDEGAQALADGIANAHDISVARIAALADDLGVGGGEAMQRFLTGLKAGLDAGLDIDVAAKLAQKISESFEGELTSKEAERIAQDFINNLARGMGDTGAIANAIKESLAGIDLSAEGQHALSTWFAAFNLGGGSGNPLDPFARRLYSDLDTVHNTVNEKGEVTGEDVPLKIAEGANANAGAVEGAGTNIIDTLMQALMAGVGQASGVGSDTGTGYGDAVAAQGHVAETAAINTLGKLLIVWLLGIASAQQAGTKTGTGFAESLATSSQKAVTAARAISIATGTAFGAGAAAAAASGNRLGTAFAQAVAASGAAAVANAQSVRNRVASIFSNMPTANIKVNVTRSVSTAPSSFGGHALQYAALPSPTPVMPVPFAASASRAATVAERAVSRMATARTSSSGTASSVGHAISAVVNSQAAPVDYDVMFRVVKSGVAAAIRESGGLTPVVELDGRRVSRQLANYLDSDLNRLREMRG